MGKTKEPVLVLGSGKLTYSVTVCLMQAGHQVTLYTDDQPAAVAAIHTHLMDMRHHFPHAPTPEDLELVDRLQDSLTCEVAVVITNENLAGKKMVIQALEEVLPATATIAINTEGIALSAIQEGASHPERIIGANWVEPAHTTLFLELVANENTPQALKDRFCDRAKASWQKDPYVVNKDFGIRARLMGAMVREAFYLLENNYVSIEDIDRACRNDAGYYLPFAGNCRYMDLMGTYIYGVVMQDLNPELSKDRQIPAFFKDIVLPGGLGMENNKGFYPYQEGEAEKWEEVFRTFSYQIQQIINKYPFGCKEGASWAESTETEPKTVPQP